VSPSQHTRPEHAEPTSLADYLAAMSRAVFTAGISWDVIDHKWDGIREAFAGFDPFTVAAFTPEDVERLMSDTRVVRNRKKIEATIANAGELLVVEREFGSMDAYLRSFADNDALVRDLHKRFAFLGDSVAHLFLFRIGFNLPAQEEWAHRKFGARVHG
jgi:DNA-3-methyladenine glycosylase I